MPLPRIALVPHTSKLPQECPHCGSHAFTRRLSKKETRAAAWHRARASVSAAERSITGHIDFLQVRNGCVHVLDYKPDARTNRPIAQPTIYALALTRRVQGLKLFDIKCAWFNEDGYCEFFPRTLSSRNSAFLFSTRICPRNCPPAFSSIGKCLIELVGAGRFSNSRPLAPEATGSANGSNVKRFKCTLSD